MLPRRGGREKSEGISDAVAHFMLLVMLVCPSSATSLRLTAYQLPYGVLGDVYHLTNFQATMSRATGRRSTEPPESGHTNDSPLCELPIQCPNKKLERTAELETPSLRPLRPLSQELRAWGRDGGIGNRHFKSIQDDGKISLGVRERTQPLKMGGGSTPLLYLQNNSSACVHWPLPQKVWIYIYMLL